MERAETMEYVRELVEPLLEEHHIELVDLELAGGHLRIFLDKEGGIGIDDCARMSRAIGNILDIEDPIRGRYVLEVSSPGLDRPLRTSRDFGRSIGKKVKIIWHQREGAYREPLVGLVQGCRDDTVILDVEDRRVEVALDDIAKAQLQLDF